MYQRGQTDELDIGGHALPMESFLTNVTIRRHWSQVTLSTDSNVTNLLSNSSTDTASRCNQQNHFTTVMSPIH